MAWLLGVSFLIISNFYLSLTIFSFFLFVFRFLSFNLWRNDCIFLFLKTFLSLFRRILWIIFFFFIRLARLCFRDCWLQFFFDFIIIFTIFPHIRLMTPWCILLLLVLSFLFLLKIRFRLLFFISFYLFLFLSKFIFLDWTFQIFYPHRLFKLKTELILGIHCFPKLFFFFNQLKFWSHDVSCHFVIGIDSNFLELFYLINSDNI